MTRSPIARPAAPLAAPRGRRGFSILELLIVIGILLAIGGLVLVNVMGARDRADIGNTKIQLNTFENALEQFRADLRRYPTEEEGLSVLWSNANLESDDDRTLWGGPYLRRPAPTDLWGSEWIYRQPSEIEGLPYDLISLGPDREEGTDDDISIHDGRLGEDGQPMDDFGAMGG